MSVFLRVTQKETNKIDSTPKNELQLEAPKASVSKTKDSMDKTFRRCSKLFHGTSTDRFPKPNVGDIVEVQNGMYTTHNENLARRYAKNSEPSIFRSEGWIHHIDGFSSPETTSIEPILLRFKTTSKTDCHKYVTGPIHYFPHGIKLKVLEVESTK